MKRGILLSVAIVQLVLLLCASSCDNSTGVEGEVGYQPPFLPFRFVLDNHGEVSIQGETQLVTFLGVFDINMKVPIKVEEDNLIIIIKDTNRVGEEIVVYEYKIESGQDEFVAVVNGRTAIGISQRQVVIDVSDGTVESIEFQKAPRSGNLIEIEGKDGFWKPFPFGYKPFMLASWAYDDSTMEKWYGLGFLWFLIRLIVATPLFIVDLFITTNMVPAVIAHSLLGETAKNVCCGAISLFWVSITALVGFADM